MNPEEIVAEDILLYGTYDWVSIADIYNYSKIEQKIDSEVGDTSLHAVSLVLRNGFAEAGTVDNGFNPWGLPIEEQIQKVAQFTNRFPNPMTELRFDFWLNLTAAGHKRGMKLREHPRYQWGEDE